MPKLSVSQLVVLTAACQRDDGCAFPITSKLKGNAAGNVLKSLLAKGLLVEVKANRDDTVWRHDEEQGSLTLQSTPAAYEALGIQADAVQSPPEAAQAATRGDKGKKAGSVRAAPKKADVKPTRAGRGKRAAGSAPKAKSEGGAPVARAGTKQEKLIAMLRRRDGTTVEEVVKALGWQAHTVRGAIAGALKKKLGLAVTSEKVEDRGRVYRIAD